MSFIEMEQTISCQDLEIEDLRGANAALRAEVERLRMALADTEALELGTAERCQRWRESYKMQEQQLAISQLEAKRLREALNQQNFWVEGVLCCKEWEWDIDQRESAEGCLAFAKEALSSPASTDALDAYVAEKVKEAMK